MREPRFPPVLSAVSIAAAVFSVLVVTTGVVLACVNSPLRMITQDPSLRFPRIALVVVAVASMIGAYLFAAPRMWSFVKRYSPASLGQQQLPAELVSPCLKDIDFACPSCTYNLRGLQGSVCPECEAPVVVYLYGARRTSTKWTALIICWLVVTLIASALTLGVVWEEAFDVLAGRSRWWRNDTDAVLVALASSGTVLLCAWRAVALAVPKPPHRQSICARRTATLLACIAAACTAAIAVRVGASLLSW